MSDIIKKPESPPAIGLTLNKGKLRSSSTPFQQRVNSARASQPDAASLPNRLCLMLDRSSSMQSYAGAVTAVASERQGRTDKPKIELLKEAIDNFVQRCDLTNTSIAVETFPASLSLDLTNVSVMITTIVATISASGNTPMRSCVQLCLEKVPMTRGIIVSDGEATDWHCYDLGDDGEEVPANPKDELLAKYKASQTPIDCVHIGDSSSGEELLRRIARETGGIYLKFTDVSAFSKGFSYLTPGYRAMLTDGRVSASELGATEVRR